MNKSTVSTQSMDHMEKQSRTSSDSSDLSRRDSTSSLHKTSSTRNSYEASSPHLPYSSSHRRRGESQSSNDSTNVPIPAEYPRSTTFDPDAPPAYREKEYQKGQGSEDVRRMSKRDYAIEMSRIMGRQLVKGLNGKGHAGGG